MDAEPGGGVPGADSRPLAVLLMGPTASGKTDLAVHLAARLPCDIVSVDSALVYRGMDIGTAKPSREVLAAAPHRLIDIIDPIDVYSTARFRADASAAMAEISAQGRIPLLVGGTMLYFRGLQHGLAHLPDADPAVREALREEVERHGLAALHARLSILDPASAARIHPKDPQRIARALEIYALTGAPMSTLLSAVPQAALPYRLLKLVRAPADRQVLHGRIEARFRAMVAAGLIDEVVGLRQRWDLHPQLPSMRCVGYRQVLSFLDGSLSFDEMLHRGIFATRQLAKRQFTWLRSELDCHWLDDAPTSPGRALGLIQEAMDVGA